MSDFSTLQLQRDPRGFVTLWLDRPDKHNAFNAAMIAELVAVFATLAAQPDIRFLMLRGRGRHFSAGADLDWMRASAALDYSANLADAHQLGEVMHRLYHLPFPTLAVVQGAAFGGAVGLTACCDMAIGTTDAQFSLSEVRLGLIPGVISPYVVQAIGERATRRYGLSAERFDGLRATELGLLAEVCPDEQLEALVQRWIATLLHNSPQAMRACKTLLQDVGSGVLSQALRERCEDAIARIRVSEQGQEGLDAFLEKRPPGWVRAAQSPQ